MLLREIFPFSTPQEAKNSPVVDPSQVNISKVFTVRTLGTSFNSGFSVFALNGQGNKRTNFESPSYDLYKIIQAIDTDSYLKQGFWKYRELIWKEGWDIISEDPEAVEYLWKRIDLFEEVMGRPFNDFLVEVGDQLVKMANAFVVEARGDISSIFSDTLNPPNGKDPISGYYLIPTEETRIARDAYNNPIKYKQSTSGSSISTGFDSNQLDPEWDAEEVIHFFLDRKPGRAFGTPFIVSALDDVIALRQLEEDVQNLVHRELSPIYQYKVGTPENPSSPEEVAAAADSLNDMRVEGGLVIPERHDISVIGSEGKALDAEPYLDQFKQRVVIGLGMSPHHLGMMSEGGNRSVTDRLDIALYDKIKSIQSYIESMIRLHIFNPILREGGFDPMEQPIGPTQSSRCYMRFREIDKDTQVKIQAHYLNLFTSNAITLEELRIKLGEKPDADMSQLLMTLTAKIQAMSQIAVAANQPQQTTTPSGAKITKPTPAHLSKPDAISPSTGGLANLPNTKKRTGNVVKPTNQFGRRTSPNIRHNDIIYFDDDQLDNLVDLLAEDDNLNEY